MIASEIAATLNPQNAAERAQEYIKTIEPYPNRFRGRGIVTCAGGLRYYPSAWVLIKMLRRLGCQLPIQVWSLGQDELDERWISLVKPLGVECVDAHEVRKRHPHPQLGGWACKPYAILHSPFEEVLFLDADNVPVYDPTFLFDDPRYLSTGAVFWPDCGRTPPGSDRWRIFGVPYRDEPDQESGQIIVNKRACWAPLNLCNWYNKHSDFFYRYIYGDKDTFHFAWRRFDQRYAMPDRGTAYIPYTICQHDFEDRRLFQHRCGAKWSLGRNVRVRGFVHEPQCFEFVEELQQLWDPIPHLTRCVSSTDRQQMASLNGRRFNLLRKGYNSWTLSLEERCRIGMRGRHREFFWWIENGDMVFAAASGQVAARLKEQPDGVWVGHSSGNPRVHVTLAPYRN